MFVVRTGVRKSALMSRTFTASIHSMTVQIPKTQKVHISIPTQTVPRTFSTEANEPVVEDLVSKSDGFSSRAIRDVAVGKYKNLPLSARKLALMCRLIRGLSVREATNQLLLSENRKSVYIRRGIRTVADYAVNIFNMNRDRLVVDEIYALKGQEFKRLDYKGRGRAAVMHRRFSHVVIKLKEQPFRVGEIRIGRYGRTIKGWKKVDKMADAWKLKQAEA